MANALHNSLRRKLALLTAVDVEFSAEHQCFVQAGERKPGLTKLLTALVPVPRSRALPDTSAPQERVPVTIQTFSGGRWLQRCGDCRAAVLATKSLDMSKSRVARRLLGERDFGIAHGIVVDYQLAYYVRHGRAALYERCGIVDPCVGTLIEQFDANGWCMIGTQLPIYDERTDIATAIDLIATDRATRTELYLIEIKATAGAVQGPFVQAPKTNSNTDVDYERVRGLLKCSVLREFTQSYHTRHQMQLLFMNDVVQRQFGFEFDRSLVMRVSPGTVRTYELASVFEERRADIVKALEQANERSKKRKQRAKQPRKKKRKPTLI